MIVIYEKGIKWIFLRFEVVEGWSTWHVVWVNKVIQWTQRPITSWVHITMGGLTRNCCIFLSLFSPLRDWIYCFFFLIICKIIQRDENTKKKISATQLKVHPKFYFCTCRLSFFRNIYFSLVQIIYLKKIYNWRQ